MEHTYTQEGSYFSFTLKLNAKGESSGEYTVRANTLDELVERNNAMKDLLRRSL